MRKLMRIPVIMLAFILAFLVFGSNYNTFVHAVEEKSAISGYMAQRIAIAHIQSSLLSSENETSSSI